MREHRKYRRFRYSFNIRCQDENGAAFIVKCVDMSSGGIRIISDKGINTGDTLDIELNFDSRFLPLRVKGKDVWQRPFIERGSVQNERDKIESGIQFLDIDNPSRSRIYNFIAKVEREKLAKIKALHTEVDMPF